MQQKYRKNTSVAQVVPMVNGHNIHKPKVRITRLNLDDLNLLTRPQQNDNQRGDDGDDESDVGAANGSQNEVINFLLYR
jgi:hypothetical protein